MIRLFGPRRIKTNRDEKHLTETDLDNWYDWDFIIFNFGTLEEFNEACCQLAKEIFNRLASYNDLSSNLEQGSSSSSLRDERQVIYFGKEFEPIDKSLGIEHVMKTALEHEKIATKILEEKEKEKEKETNEES